MADVVVAGAAGRMGSRIVACLRDAPELPLAAALEAPGHPALGRDAGQAAAGGKLKPVIDRIFGLNETPEAFAVLRRGQVLGKVIVKL